MAEPEISPLSSGSFEQLKERLECARKQHRTLDSLWYNGGTVVILLCTGAASFMPTVLPCKVSLAQTLAAIGAFLVALERALSFGARWRFHKEMDGAYNALLDMLTFYQATDQSLSPAERHKYLQDFTRELYVVRRREAGIPGSGTESRS
jgi:hypothetical protein